MSENEIYMYRRNIINLLNDIKILENECHIYDQRIIEVKTENKLLYSKEYDLIHKILHYEKKLSEYTNLKQKNHIILSSAKKEYSRIENKLNKLKCVKEKLISSMLSKKNLLEQKITSIQYKLSDMKIYTSNTNVPNISYVDLLPVLYYKINVMKNILNSIQNDNKTQSIYIEEKKYMNFVKLREMINNTNEKIDESEFDQPYELIKRLDCIISPILSKNNYYEFIEKEANIKELKEMKERMRIYENRVLLKLNEKRKIKMTKLYLYNNTRFFVLIKEDYIKNKKTKQVKFNIKPEIINSDYYQSTENNKKSNKVIIILIRKKGLIQEKKNKRVKNIIE
jgi:hypothetical protein